MKCNSCGKEVVDNYTFCPFCGRPTENDAEQLYLEGMRYYNVKNYAEALKWLRQAAERNHLDAQYWLGVMYDTGKEVAQDYVEAVKWYRQAAEQGNANAQLNLGFMYEEGQGIEQNYVEAVKWYWKAAQQGDLNAQCNLGFMYEEGKGVERNYVEAAKWYRTAAERGLARAQHNLAWMYYKGKGVRRDPYEAVIWLKKAAKQGNVVAREGLEWLNKNGRYDSYNNEVDVAFNFGFGEPVTISEVCVKVGDEICMWDVLIKWYWDTFSTRFSYGVQNEKVAGVVTNIYVKKGQKLNEGDVILTIRRCDINKKPSYYGPMDFNKENHTIRLIKGLFGK